MALFALLLVTRHEKPPATTDDVCAVFRAKVGWYRATLRSEARWGVPAPVQLAVLLQESSFRARARPPRRWLWGVIPWRRPSTAYGYAQVLDGTWQAYLDHTGRRRASRAHFVDAVDFVGWYATEIERAAGVARDDAHNLYLAYHEGPAGYARGSHRAKPWLLETARKVSSRAAAYRRQLDDCADDVRRRSRGRRLATVAVMLGVALALAGPVLRRRGWLRPPRRMRRALRRRRRRRQKR